MILKMFCGSALGSPSRSISRIFMALGVLILDEGCKREADDLDRKSVV